ESVAAIHEIVFLLLEASKCESNIEAPALVGNRDEGALASQHDLDRNYLGRIAAVAMLESVAESVFQRYQQIPDQFQPCHPREPFQQHGLKERKKLLLSVAANARVGVRDRDARVGEIAQRIAEWIRRIDRSEGSCSCLARVDQ